MSKVIQKEVHDEAGNIVRIEAVYKDTGEHVLDILWDPNDEQTAENRDEFRKWANRILRSKGLEPIN
jgi:hypothetical protein